MVTLLGYLQKKNVKGTKARGNFPREHIRAIAAGFVHPPTLDVKIGNQTWKLQSEDEVPDLMRYHLLACIAGLIFGGEDLHWEVLPQGELFLSLPPESQVWYLSSVWFRYFNWIYEYEESDWWPLMSLKRSVIGLFSSYPRDEIIPIERVFSDLASAGISGGKAALDEETFSDLKDFVKHVVLQPLATFGIIKLEELNPEVIFFSNITGIQIAELGHFILDEQKEYFRMEA
jgi:hypothetical protein